MFCDNKQKFIWNSFLGANKMLKKLYNMIFLIKSKLNDKIPTKLFLKNELMFEKDK